MNSIRNAGVLLALLAVLLWSTVATVFKLGLMSYSGYQLLLYSVFFSTLTLGLLLIFLKQKSQLFNFNRYYVRQTLLQSLLNPFLYYIILFAAYERLPAQIAQPINFTWPIFLAVFAAIFFKEKVTRAMYFALIISFVGVLIISAGSKGIDGDYGNWTNGVMLCVLSAIVWAYYWIVSTKDPRPPVIKVFWTFALSLMYLLLYGGATKQLPAVTFSYHLLYPLYIGLFEMSITFLLWLAAMRKGRDTPFLGNMAYLVPVISLFIIRAVLKEQIQFSTVIGMVFIIAGVLIQARIRPKIRR